MSFAQDLLILGVATTHVVLTPFAKVEESFNLHALHDILMYGIKPDALTSYDHFVFSGAVPRSFIGGLLVAATAMPFVRLANMANMLSSKLDLQIMLRLTLALCNAVSLCLLRRSVQRRFGRLTAVLFTLLTCTQFHLPFWMGRTIPNMFALLPANLAFWLLLGKERNAIRVPSSQVSMALFLFTSAGVVLRAEVTGLLIPFALQCLAEGSIAFFDLIRTGIMSGLISIAATVAIDSYFWKEWPLWPEFTSLFFNVVEGRSAEWGVSPSYTYFTSYLPKLLLGALPLSVLGTFIDSRVRAFIIPALTYIVLISGIGHKEWRFIVYTVPLFNIAAARGARALLTMRKSSLVGRLMFLAVLGVIGTNITYTSMATYSSMINYPGGDALVKFNDMYSSQSHVHVHISNLAAQTGASLFTQTHAPPYPTYLKFARAPDQSKDWVYNKTENLTRRELIQGPFTHLISETPIKDKDWIVSATVEGFDGWKFERSIADLFLRKGRKGLFDVLQPRKVVKLWIVERRR
ncbi:alpha-1,6-mannosyltransferase subunit [Vararia minispora EC-137]|uniref:Alpha-1,6-mannosyltransferase subunit n=1 Tax=Vararia minispora EC-137 TaxID=1314806 RepID=A0ACB8QSI4_9AGAM|nr:alpha-1,6-mannosyltransferase subunit [Vararia minispora EC-137]